MSLKDINTIIFPSSFFDTFSVDEDFQAEYDAVVATGDFSTVFFDYDKWFNYSELKLSRKPESPVKALYRGWMMKGEQYELFYNRLLERGIELVTNPTEYARFHLFPNIYPSLKTDTAKILTFPKDEKPDLALIKKTFKRFMIKDYVKSEKGYSAVF